MMLPPPIVSSVLWLLAAGFWLAPPPGEQGSVNEGKVLYLKYCSACHGADGKGEGPAAIYLNPKPRDFTSGIFKFQSTPVGSLPTDDDLHRTLENGMPGSAMPAWDRLSRSQRSDLVAFVKTFSDRFATEQPSDVVLIEQEPTPTPDLVHTGKAVYALAGCWMCHGKTGAGDGPSSKGMTDDLGRPIVPYSFIRTQAFKGGGTPRDIYRTFTTGIGGTPMPGYGEDALTISREAVEDVSGLADQYSQEEIEEFKRYMAEWPTEKRLQNMSPADRKRLADDRRWSLVYYVLSLSQSGKPPISYTTADRELSSVAVPALSEYSHPGSTAWRTVNGTELPLISLWQRDAPTDRVLVQSVTDGKWLVLRLEWEDVTKDDGALFDARFGDAAAIQFPMDRASDPFFGMGDTSFAVNMWHWKSVWENDVQQFAGVQSAFPNNATDFYPFDVSGRSSAEYFASKDSARTLSKAWNTGWGSGNLLSAQIRKSSVEDLNARGFGTLTSQGTKDQNVRGRGIWSGGKWAVVFMREMQSTQSDDVRFEARSTIPIGIAVWDGSLGDRNGQKLVTNWYRLFIR